jgi:peptidoglycan/LPS O-acetylase OafA/YrhL
MKYRKDIDALKGLSIIAVVLYHIGLLKSGYLGVDVFFVINGFLIIPGLILGAISTVIAIISLIRKEKLVLSVVSISISAPITIFAIITMITGF